MSTTTYEGFTAEERAAMKDHAQEQKKAVRRGGRADKAALDDGAMWPASYALTAITPETEARITALVKQAVS